MNPCYIIKIMLFYVFYKLFNCLGMEEEDRET